MVHFFYVLKMQEYALVYAFLHFLPVTTKCECTVLPLFARPPQFSCTTLAPGTTGGKVFEELYLYREVCF